MGFSWQILFWDFLMTGDITLYLQLLLEMLIINEKVMITIYQFVYKTKAIIEFNVPMHAT